VPRRVSGLPTPIGQPTAVHCDLAARDERGVVGAQKGDDSGYLGWFGVAAHRGAAFDVLGGVAAGALVGVVEGGADVGGVDGDDATLTITPRPARSMW
jgi:hypothetical protein